MNQLNSIILEGNVVKKAEFSEPTSGFYVCRFPIAVNRKTKSPNGDSHEEVSYFDVETYGTMAEKCSKYCDKGKGVRVVGRLKQNRWEENNVKRSKVFVIAEHVEYKFSKPKGEAQAELTAENPPQAEAKVEASDEAPVETKTEAPAETKTEAPAAESSAAPEQKAEEAVVF